MVNKPGSTLVLAILSRLVAMSESSTPPTEPSNSGSHYQPAMGIVAVILLLFVTSTFLILRSNNSSAPSPTSTSTSIPATTTTTKKSHTTTTTTKKHTTTTTSKKSHTTTTTSPAPVHVKSKVRVQIANGTSIAGIAHTLTSRLTTANWDALPAINASAKAPASVVYFKAGYQWAASQIATALGLSQKSLTPLGSQVPALGAQSDDVVVVLGPDITIKG